MQSGVIERIRQLHADIEQHRVEVTTQLMVPASNFRHQLLIDHFVFRKVKQIAAKSAELLDLYEDQDYEAASVEEIMPNEALREFDSRVAQLRDYHRKYPQQVIRETLDEPRFEDGYVSFDVAERHGRCLALQEHYSRFVTFIHVSGKRAAAEHQSAVKRVDKVMDYEEFAGKILDIFHTTPCSRKMSGIVPYSKFVIDLLAYVEDFFNRIRPLHRSRMAYMIEETKREFDGAWEGGAIPGWTASICGSSGLAKKTALAESFVERYLKLMPDVVEKTHNFIVRQKTKTIDEIEKEMEEEEEQLAAQYRVALTEFQRRAGGGSAAAAAAALAAETTATSGDADADDDLAAAAKFNRKGFPLDEEGKPIPVWLYHLHGLHKKYYCEICQYSYMGEMAYTTHFADIRHSQGLQRLGIPKYSDEFKLVSGREAAIELWKKSQARKVGQKFVSSRDDEQVVGPGGLVTTVANRPQP